MFCRNNRITLILLILLAITLLPPAAASAAGRVVVSAPAVVGDGTAFPVSFEGKGLTLVTASFLNRSVTARADENGKAVVLLPVPLEHASLSSAPVAWRAVFSGGGKEEGSATVAIRKKTYPAQRLTLAPKYVTPDPALKDRIAKESAALRAALTTHSPERRWTLPMHRPVAGKVTSWYGLRRILNGEPRAPHRGLDFRGAAGTPIGAIGKGVVVLTGDFYYPGTFVVLDHGLGVTSIYMHLSGTEVVEGQEVRAGDSVGRIGSTGRSTGPHLHLGISVLGQSIDPFPLLAMTAEDNAAYAKAFTDAAEEERLERGKAAAPKVPARKNVSKNAGKKE